MTDDARKPHVLSKHAFSNFSVEESIKHENFFKLRIDLISQCMGEGVTSVGSDSWHCLEKITVAKKYNNQDIKSIQRSI